MGYNLNLQLPEEPSPAVLLSVMRLLGVLTPGGDDAAAVGDDQTSAPAAAAEKQDSLEPRNTEPLMLDREGAANMLGVSTSTLDRLRKRGALPVIQIEGSAPMFSRKALRQFVQMNSKCRARRMG